MKASLRTYDTPGGLLHINKVTDQILHLEYKDRESLCSAFLRVSEASESPEFKGKIFTLGQYRKWYSSYYGTWTYLKDWSGFNIPSKEFKPFIEGLFDPLGVGEAELIEMLKYKDGEYCVIGTYKGGDSDVLEHEICHALYATNKEYKAQVDAALAKYEGKLDDLKKVLTVELGYNEAVVMDECHAYICESFQWLKDKKIPFPDVLRIELQAIKSNFTPNKEKS